MSANDRRAFVEAKQISTNMAMNKIVQAFCNCGHR